MLPVIRDVFGESNFANDASGYTQVGRIRVVTKKSNYVVTI
jgi:hypothetical protein